MWEETGKYKILEGSDFKQVNATIEKKHLMFTIISSEIF